MKAKVFLQRILLSVLIAAISVSAFGQTATQVTPSVDRLRTHITYLASDALEGRRTGTPGAQGAAQYIAGEFTNLGLRPGMQAGRTARTRGEAKSRYLQHFPYVAGVALGKNNVLRLVPVAPAPSSGDATKVTSTIEFRIGEEWAPLGLSSQALVADAPLAFVNYGITAAELKYDDYAGKPVTGHIAVAFAGTPDGDNPHGKFARYEDVQWKAIAARNAGAKALLVIVRDPNFKDDPLSRLRYDNRGSGDAGLPVAAVSRQAAERMLQASGVLGSLSELETLLREVISNSLTSGESDKSLEPKLLGAVKVTLTTDIVRREVAASNVIGILEGSDPVLKNEAIVIGAHYDHLGRGGAGSLAPRQGAVHHGADDNASGVAGILELARTFVAQRPRPRRTIVFIAFGGEEEGLLGSNYYVNHPVVPMTNTVAMINLDMIGRLKNQSLVIGGVGTAPEWRSMIESANLGQTLSSNSRITANTSPASADHVRVEAASGGTMVINDSSKTFQLTLNEDGFGPSDHSSFYAKQIPVLFFWTGTHEDYHKPSDTADKINYQDEARILSMVGRIVRDVDANHKRPTYTVAKSASTGRSTGFRVYLGTIPNYSDSSDGLLLDGVREGSPAAAAGMQAGDRIVKLAGREVRNVYDYTYALGEMKAGQEYEVEILRGSERLKLKLTPAARK